jgi:hypothetical protein
VLGPKHGYLAKIFQFLLENSCFHPMLFLSSEFFLNVFILVCSSNNSPDFLLYICRQRFRTMVFEDPTYGFTGDTHRVTPFASFGFSVFIKD